MYSIAKDGGLVNGFDSFEKSRLKSFGKYVKIQAEEFSNNQIGGDLGV
jgi:hypothetical protein